MPNICHSEIILCLLAKYNNFFENVLILAQNLTYFELLQLKKLHNQTKINQRNQIKLLRMSNLLMKKGKSSGILISFIYLPNNTDIKSTVTLVSNGSGLLLCIFSCFLLG